MCRGQPAAHRHTDTSETKSEKERPIVIQASLPVPTVTDVQPKTNDDMGVGMTKIKSMKTAIRKRPKVEIEMNLSKKSRTKGNIIGYSDDEQVDELPFRTKGGDVGEPDEGSCTQSLIYG